MDLPHGEVMHIPELLSDKESMDGRCVRVLGSLVEHNVEANQVVIEYNQKSLKVETSLVGAFDFQMGGLFQFIGELRLIQGDLLLKARVARDVSGLDLSLFEKSLEVKRRFENEINGMQM